MDISLQTLVLQNFMGGTFTLPANCEDVNVYGANGSGKTRLASAMAWLLFDKDSLGRSDFEIKNLDAQGEEEHGLEHSVEGVFCVNGAMMVLKKAYKELWTKKRGSPKAIFTGHTTDYYLDGVPVQKKEYTARVADLAGDESVFRLLTSPIAFPSMHWQKQRALLLEVCGDMTDLQVIETNDELTALIPLLDKYSKSKHPFDDLKAVITSRRAEINKMLDSIPVRIDEVRRGLPDVTGLSRAKLGVEVVTLEKAVNDAKAKLHGIDNGAEIAELSKRLAGVNADIQKLEQDHYGNAIKSVTRLNAKITEVQDNIANHGRRIKGIKDALQFKKDTIATMETKLARLRERWGAIDAETFQDTTEEICAACGQPLPSDRVEEAREKARENFNQRRAERLTDIEQEGKGIASARDNLVIDIAKLEEDLSGLSLSYEPSKDVDDLMAERDAAKKIAEDYSGIPERSDLLIVKAAIERDMAAARESVAIDRGEVTKEVETLTAQLAEAKGKADLFPKREQGEARIEELKQYEKDLAKEYEELERQLYLCDLFIRTKVSLLTERINRKFELVRFKLFETQVNGGLSECCMLTINGVPYEGGLNNAARIQGGLDIIRTLQAHYSLRVPVVIDNRESVTEIPGMDCQIISLVVSPEDINLRVETAAKTLQAA